jgi:hypothetical protein
MIWQVKLIKADIYNGFEIELTRLVKSPLPLFAKEGESLPLEKGGEEGFSESILIIMKPLITYRGWSCFYAFHESK